MASRSIRKQPFCWQEKKILRFIKEEFKGEHRVKMLCLYQSLTWIDSDFNGKDINYYSKTIHTYSGLTVKFVSKGLQWFNDVNIISIVTEEKEMGRFANKKLTFTPENIKDDKVNDTNCLTVGRSTTNGQAVNGQTTGGQAMLLEDSSLLEHSTYKEDSNNNKGKEKSVKTPPVRLTKQQMQIKKQVGVRGYKLLADNNQMFVGLGRDKIVLFIDWMAYRYSERKVPIGTQRVLKSQLTHFHKNGVKVIQKAMNLAKESGGSGWIDIKYAFEKVLQAQNGNGFKQPATPYVRPQQNTLQSWK